MRYLLRVSYARFEAIKADMRKNLEQVRGRRGCVGRGRPRMHFSTWLRPRGVVWAGPPARRGALNALPCYK